MKTRLKFDPSGGARSGFPLGDQSRARSTQPAEERYLHASQGVPPCRWTNWGNCIACSYMFVVRFAVSFLVAGALVSFQAAATSVRPPEFSDLVEKAEVVVRGEVVGVRCEWRGTADTRRIVTLVRFRIDRALIGHPPEELELEFLGGKVGTERLEISGMPEFRVGDRDIIFVQNNGRQLCPLVGFSHGRYLVVDGAFAWEPPTVARNNTVPLESVEEVTLPLSEGAAVVQQLKRVKRAPLTVEQFEAAIVQRAMAQGRRDVRTLSQQ